MTEPVGPDPGGGGFREPWQAKAFALVVLLHRQGHFAWEEWVRTLAAEVAARPQRAEEDADAAYHRQFLAALEAITAARGLATAPAMSARARQWRQAYLNTPHGHPVELANAGEAAAEGEGHDEDEHGHDHAHAHGGLQPQRVPVAISPGARHP
ncbi:nitrile hydratase accessory protein [Paracraurococcus lichenis]|uniref:Nitrile hydratase accessory protein n=1 Tax=Paracraurococcus lichenis TaxID=3064888 RepID=A0ABT9E0T7_9PROT|nr:nitrile hydratase accessory protein [Paracraurococcus sp. LOR1-02]MDO9709756.1 nitrile hydratase accessory protein [Paracraurococcus sp. LOR1-02]